METKLQSSHLPSLLRPPWTSHAYVGDKTTWVIAAAAKPPQAHARGVHKSHNIGALPPLWLLHRKEEEEMEPTDTNAKALADHPSTRKDRGGVKIICI